MANIDNPNGFQPFLAAGQGSAKVTYFDLAAANTIIGTGDPVYSTGGYVDRAPTGNAIIGIAAEPKAASSGGTIAVWADPMQLFVAQTDSATTGTLEAATAAQLNADHVAGNASGGKSIAEIDENTGNTTATLTFKLIRLSPEYTGDNGAANAYGVNNRWIVKINNHQLGSHTGTEGT